MADMEKERTEESMDDGAFSMYSDWIENGEAGYEQEMSQPPAREEAQAESDAAKEKTIESLSKKCEELKDQIDSEKGSPEGGQENIDRLESELAETVRHLHLQVLKYAQGDTVGSLSEKCEDLRQQIRKVRKESENAAMDEFEKRYLDGEPMEVWKDARKEFETANFYASENYNVNLEQFFPADNAKDRLESELAGAEKRLQVLYKAQEVEWASHRKTVPGTEKNTTGEQAEPRNPLEALIKIVEKNAPEEAAALKEVQQYMEEMDSNYKSMHRELIALKIQLADHIDGSGMGSSGLKNLEKNAEELKAHNDGFKKNIFQKAADVIEKFKAKGTTVLNNVVQKLGIKEALQNDQKYYQDNAAKMQKAVGRLDAINSEIYAAKSHIKNIGRLAAGKEAGQPQQGRENIIIKILKKPYVHDRDMYQQMADKTGQRIERLEKLEEKAARAKSTLAKLSDYKKKAGSRSEDQQEKQDRENTRKEPQMAL